MATHVEGNYISREAASDLSDKQYYLVKLNSSNKVELCSAATDKILGVLSNAPEAGETAVVRLINSNGTFKVKTAASNISQGARLTADSAGKAVATTTVGNVVFGRMLVASTASDIAEYLCDDDVYAATS